MGSTRWAELLTRRAIRAACAAMRAEPRARARLAAWGLRPGADAAEVERVLRARREALFGADS